ncbi:MAG TPA: hypothetical protein VMU84_05970 [Thermoanaerobaculia bacterium]|nr:hypothetical protein [Thermoanaerobaculia bacterium]
MQWRESLTQLFPAVALLPPGAFIVGGAVRDLLLGREPADIDVACTDPFACASLLGRKVIRLGNEEHLSAYRVVLGEHVYDFAQLLDDNIDRDLARRDFTVNAMAVDLGTDTLLDPHGGEDDIHERLVRMVHATNFDDDPLRTLKGVRMAVKYVMTIDDATCEAIRERAEKIVTVAEERVTYEISVIFSSNAFRKAIDLLRRTNLDLALFGRALDARAFHADDVPLAAALALLVDDPREYAERWRWSEHLARDVVALKRLLKKCGTDTPVCAALGSTDKSVCATSKVDLFDAGEHVARQLPAMLRALGHDDRIEFPDFSTRALLTGEEIAHATGLPPGKELGRIKRALLDAQIDGQIHTREAAIVFVQSLQSSRT